MFKDSATTPTRVAVGVIALACGVACAPADLVSAQSRGKTLEVVDLNTRAARVAGYEIPARAGVGKLLLDPRDLARGEAPARRRIMRNGSKVYYQRGITVRSNVVVVLSEDVTSFDKAREEIEGALSRPPAALAGGASVRHIDEMPPNWVVVDFPTVGGAIDALEAIEGVAGVQHVELDVDWPRASYSIPTDPDVTYQWHLNNTLFPGADTNVQAVWDSGITGSGVVIGTMDAGDWNMQLTHPDLVNNIRMDLVQPYSPFPEVDHLGVGDHATSVAGIIAAEANNGIGVSGIAYNAKLAAMVNNGGAPSISTGLSYKDSQIAVKNHSWGFPTVQAVFEENGGLAPPFPIVVPNTLAGGELLDTVSLALVRTYEVDHQRQVFAAGNGNLHENFGYLQLGNAVQTDENGLLIDVGFNADVSDQSVSFVSATPYAIGERTEYGRFTKWRDSIVIAGIGENNEHTWYSTTGCNVLACAYTEGASVVTDGGSSGAWDYASRSMVSTSEVDGYTDASELGGHPSQTAPNAIYPGGDVTLGDGYTAIFNGTSAAAPVATGIIGLMLEANPTLSTRDIKRIIQATADWTRIQPTAIAPDLNQDGNPDWTTIEEELGATVTSNSYYGEWTYWQVNDGDVPHSDEYGFGVIDAEAAVNMARNYGGSPQLVTADSGLLPVEDGEIEDATYVPVSDDNELEQFLTPGARQIFTFCVPSNLRIEDVEATVTIEGVNAGDLLIELISPSGTRSILSYPRIDDNSFNYNGTDYVLYRYKFNSLKHWGEISGGRWRIAVTDWRPDDVLPSGETDDSDPPMTVPCSVDLGKYGRPSFAENTGTKTVTELGLKIYGTATGLPQFDYCGLVSGTCPGDVDGDGRVDVRDLLKFIELWKSGDPLADVDGDGVLTFNDLLTFFRSWQAGPCDTLPSQPWDDNKPSVRPIDGEF